MSGPGAAAPACPHCKQSEGRLRTPQLHMDRPLPAQAYWEMRKLVVTPNVPNYVNITAPMDTFTRPVVPLEQRNLLMYFSGRCGPHDDGNLGKLFRHAPLSSSAPGVAAGATAGLPDRLCKVASRLSGGSGSLLPGAAFTQSVLRQPLARASVRGSVPV